MRRKSQRNITYEQRCKNYYYIEPTAYKKNNTYD